MLTLRTLKGLIDIPKRGERVPSAKKFREGKIPVIAQKVSGQGERMVNITVYKCGYAVYQVANRVRVFPVNLELSYGYSSVVESAVTEQERYGDWDSKNKMRKKKCFSRVEESFFDEEEWCWRLMLIGEDRLAANLSNRDRKQCCFSYDGISEDFKGLADPLMEIEEQISRKQIVDELMSILNEEQKELVKSVYWEHKTHEKKDYYYEFHSY